MKLLLPASENSVALRLAGMGKTYGPMQVLDGFDLSVGSRRSRRADGSQRRRQVNAGQNRVRRGAAGQGTNFRRRPGGEPCLSTGSARGRHRHRASIDGPAWGCRVFRWPRTSCLTVCAPAVSVFSSVSARFVKGHKLLRPASGLMSRSSRDFGELGPAHRQLVAIARAVAADASVLIFDEPTATLAAAEAARLFDVIERLRARGVGILYISHRLADISRVADRIVVMRNGRLVADQVRPFDLAAAVKAMIGRDLDQIGTRRAFASTGRPVLNLDAGAPDVCLRAFRPFDSCGRDRGGHRRARLRQESVIRRPVRPIEVRGWPSRS